MGLFGGGVAAIIGVLFAIFSFLFVDMFDSIGVLVGVGIKAGFVNEKGELPGAGKALFVSAAGAAVGAVFGTQTVTVFGAESTTGIAEGGRTGLTAITTGVFFLLSLLFTPLFLMIPSIATAPALVMVGIFMIEPLMLVDLSDTKTAFPVSSAWLLWRLPSISPMVSSSDCWLTLADRSLLAMLESSRFPLGY